MAPFPGLVASPWYPGKVFECDWPKRKAQSETPFPGLSQTVRRHAQGDGISERRGTPELQPMGMKKLVAKPDSFVCEIGASPFCQDLPSLGG